MTESAAPPASLDPVVAKARAVQARLLEMAERLAEARGVAHDAQVREAVTRAELTDALAQALSARADDLARARALTVRNGQEWRPTSGRRHNRLSRRIDQVLARAGSFGAALVIARAGVWRGTGRRAFDLRHIAAYVRRRGNPLVQPLSLFDQAWYLQENPDVASAGAAPLLHYLTRGGFEGRAPHPLFDDGFYRGRNAAELGETGVTPLEHFLRWGSAQLRDPHPLFDVTWYGGQAPDVAPGEDVVSHYVRTGWAQNLSPHPLFDAHWYAAQMPVHQRTTPPLLHYLQEGWRAGLSPHPLFDPTWYLESYPDVAEAGVEPLSHFLLAGASEGRSPGPWFDLPHYVAARGGALAPDRNPLVDYLHGGAWQVGEASPGFPTSAYLAAHPQIARDGLTPLEHWARQQAR
ncbi:hypothetical protein [Phenylobacterium deserti]|uniref:Uncharacterized protein n=1 Tax=Phenylobacterium deserti TaxID=1914756 RepID=A0A328AS43_9CAUL|nr:hypothetical protein [Phenylobacterium deserti]RAK57872.1 hypothetical protein DJ018_08165 [Phenylobacterium deserti]